MRMFEYDLQLALQSLKRHRGLSMLMVLAVALGIAVCTMTFTIYHAMATNPIEWKGDQTVRASIQRLQFREHRPRGIAHDLDAATLAEHAADLGE